MTDGQRNARREWLELVGDAVLISAAAMALLTALVLLISLAYGDRELPVVAQIASALIALVGSTGGPVLTWTLHSRRFSLPAIGGAIAGGAASGVAFGAFVALSTALGWVLRPISDSEVAGPLVAAALLALAFVVLAAWLVVIAVRGLGLGPGSRRLAIARLVSAAVVVVFAAAVVVIASGPAGPEVLEAGAFMLAAAANGGFVVAGAELATWLLARGNGAGAATAE